MLRDTRGVLVAAASEKHSAHGRYKIRHKLQKSIKSVGHMQDQVQQAMDWLCQMYNISMDDAMRCTRLSARAWLLQ